MRGRTYARIRINPGFDRSAFGRAKAQGLITTSFDTMIKRLDGSESIVSWPSAIATPEELSGRILETYNRETLKAYLVANRLLYYPQGILNAAPSRTMVSRMAAAIKGIAVGPDNVITPLPASPESKWRAWDWLVLATAAAAIGGLIYYFTRG